MRRARREGSWEGFSGGSRGTRRAQKHHSAGGARAGSARGRVTARAVGGGARGPSPPPAAAPPLPLPPAPRPSRPCAASAASEAAAAAAAEQRGPFKPPAGAPAPAPAPARARPAARALAPRPAAPPPARTWPPTCTGSEVRPRHGLYAPRARRPRLRAPPRPPRLPPTPPSRGGPRPSPPARPRRARAPPARLGSGLRCPSRPKMAPGPPGPGGRARARGGWGGVGRRRASGAGRGAMPTCWGPARAGTGVGGRPARGGRRSGEWPRGIPVAPRARRRAAWAWVPGRSPRAGARASGGALASVPREQEFGGLGGWGWRAVSSGATRGGLGARASGVPWQGPQAGLRAPRAWPRGFPLSQGFLGGGGLAACCRGTFIPSAGLSHPQTFLSPLLTLARRRF